MKEKMMEKMMDILDRLNRHQAALGFVADHVPDHQASITVWAIQDDLKRTINKLKKVRQR